MATNPLEHYLFLIDVLHINQRLVSDRKSFSPLKLMYLPSSLHAHLCMNLHTCVGTYMMYIHVKVHTCVRTYMMHVHTQVQNFILLKNSRRTFETYLFSTYVLASQSWTIPGTEKLGLSLLTVDSVCIIWKGVKLIARAYFST